MEASTWHCKNRVEYSQEQVENQLASPYLSEYHEGIL